MGILVVLGGLLGPALELPRISLLTLVIGWMAGMCLATGAPVRMTKARGLAIGIAWGLMAGIALSLTKTNTPAEIGRHASPPEVAISISFVYFSGAWFGWTSATLVSRLLDRFWPRDPGPRC